MTLSTTRSARACAARSARRRRPVVAALAALAGSAVLAGCAGPEVAQSVGEAAGGPEQIPVCQCTFVEGQAGGVGGAARVGENAFVHGDERAGRIGRIAGVEGLGERVGGPRAERSWATRPRPGSSSADSLVTESWSRC